MIVDNESMLIAKGAVCGFLGSVPFIPIYGVITLSVVEFSKKFFREGNFKIKNISVLGTLWLGLATVIPIAATASYFLARKILRAAATLNAPSLGSLLIPVLARWTIDEEWKMKIKTYPIKV